MKMLTCEEARAVHKVLAEGDRQMYLLLRRWAADRYVESLHERGIFDADCGGSDVSCEINEALRFYEVPMVGPVIQAYEKCGLPGTDQIVSEP